MNPNLLSNTKNLLMKTFKTVGMLFVLLACVAHISCRKSVVGPCGGDWHWSSELSSEAQQLSSAASLYAESPTSQNCSAYVQAYQDYLDAAERLDNCARQVGQHKEYQEAIDDARDALNDLGC